jgi:hypothetical protein
MRSPDLAARKNSQSSYFLIAPCPGFGDFHTTSSAHNAWQSVHRWRDPLLPQRRNVVPVEASWSCGAIKQHCDAGCAKANIDNRAGPVSQLWAPKSPKFAHLKASADNKSVCLPTNHSTSPNPQIQKFIGRDSRIKISVQTTSDQDSRQPAAIDRRECTWIRAVPAVLNGETRGWNYCDRHSNGLNRRRRHIERSINTVMLAPGG